VRYERRKSDTPDTAIDIVKKLLRGYFSKKPVDKAHRDGCDVRHPFSGNFTKVLGVVKLEGA